MSATAPIAPLKYRGARSSYVDIAIRNEEHLGFSMEYAVHPSGIGCFILRFVVHGNGVDPKNYTHLTYRESAKFVIPVSESHPTAELFRGVRLNKIAIPVFKPAIQPHELQAYCATFDIWSKVTAWVIAQVEAEGFTLALSVHDLANELAKLVIPPMTTGTVECVLEFPAFDAPEHKAAALKLVQKPEPDEEDEDEGDEDEKEWLN